MSALLFDIDGTLTDTAGAGKAALGPAMIDVYGETGPIETFDFHGRTDPEIVRGLLTAVGWEDSAMDAGLPALWPIYLSRLADALDEIGNRARPLAGVLDLLDRLATDTRFACGLVTGNLEEGARLKLQAAGCAGRFEFGGFGSDAEHRADLPPVALARASARFGRTFGADEAVVIGDTPADIECARASGARVLAVATGRHSVSELAAHAPDAVIPDLTEADQVMEFLLND